MERIMCGIAVALCIIGIAMGLSTLMDLNRESMEKCLVNNSRDTCITSLR